MEQVTINDNDAAIVLRGDGGAELVIPSLDESDEEGEAPEGAIVLAGLMVGLQRDPAGVLAYLSAFLNEEDAD